MLDIDAIRSDECGTSIRCGVCVHIDYLTLLQKPRRRGKEEEQGT